MSDISQLHIWEMYYGNLQLLCELVGWILISIKTSKSIIHIWISISEDLDTDLIKHWISIHGDDLALGRLTGM